MKVKQKGKNSSVVDGKELLKEEEAIGKHEDQVETPSKLSFWFFSQLLAIERLSW